MFQAAIETAEYRQGLRTTVPVLARLKQGTSAKPLQLVLVALVDDRDDTVQNDQIQPTSQKLREAGESRAGVIRL